MKHANRKSRNYGLMTLLILSLQSCKDALVPDLMYFFNIKNNSQNDILYFVNDDYPDISIPDSTSKDIHMVKLAPNEQFTFDTSEKWQKYFDSLPADTLSIFFLSPDTVSKYGWKQVQSKYLILKRKDISYEDLKNSKNTISYP